MSVEDKLKHAIKTAQDRGKIYGESHDNFRDNGQMLAAMFPDGVILKTGEEFSRFLLLSLITVKLCRYAKNLNVSGHQDSIHDAGVYSFILEDYDDSNNRR